MYHSRDAGSEFGTLKFNIDGVVKFDHSAGCGGVLHGASDACTTRFCNNLRTSHPLLVEHTAIWYVVHLVSDHSYPRVAIESNSQEAINLFVASVCGSHPLADMVTWLAKLPRLPPPWRY